jgi:hypothetical protein
MKNNNISIIVIFFLLLTTPSLSLASQGCFRDRTPDIVVCPPPNGGIAADTEQNFVCGVGWCTVDVAEKVKCSQVPGGAAIVDQYGNALCVGGCMDAIPSLCRRIELPKITK